MSLSRTGVHRPSRLWKMHAELKSNFYISKDCSKECENFRCEHFEPVLRKYGNLQIDIGSGFVVTGLGKFNLILPGFFGHADLPLRSIENATDAPNRIRLREK